MDGVTSALSALRHRSVKEQKRVVHQQMGAFFSYNQDLEELVQWNLTSWPDWERGGLGQVLVRYMGFGCTS